MSRDRERTYRFYVKPLDENATENIGLFLASLGISKDESEHAYIIVEDAEVFGVYEMLHEHITQLKRSQFEVIGVRHIKLIHFVV